MPCCFRWLRTALWRPQTLSLCSQANGILFSLPLPLPCFQLFLWRSPPLQPDLAEFGLPPSTKHKRGPRKTGFHTSSELQGPLEMVELAGKTVTRPKVRTESEVEDLGLLLPS